MRYETALGMINDTMGWKCEDFYECTQMVAFISEEIPKGYRNAILANDILKLFRYKIIHNYKELKMMYAELMIWYVAYKRYPYAHKKELIKYIDNESKEDIKILLKNYWVYHLCQIKFTPFKKILNKTRLEQSGWKIGSVKNFLPKEN